MGSDFRWAMCAVDDDTFASVQRRFKSVVMGAPDEGAARALTVFMEEPERLLPRFKLDGGRHIEILYAKEFCELFNVQGADAILRDLKISQDVVRFLSGETPPALVLFFSLGHVLAGRLPGRFGNIFLNHAEVEHAITRVERVLAEVDSNCWGRARQMISSCTVGRPSLHHDAEIDEILCSLPDALREAKRRRQNFFALSFWLG